MTHALAGIPLGLLAGAGLGLVARRSGGWGGYASFRRRAARLAHVSLVALPLLSGFYGLALSLRGETEGLVLAGFAAPIWVASCLLLTLALLAAAWRERLATWLLPLPALGAVLSGALIGLAALPGGLA